MSAPRATQDAAEGPQSALERKYIQVEQQHLMREASKYASLKLAEVESRAKFRHDIHAPS
jgi:hypothetical protein